MSVIKVNNLYKNFKVKVKESIRKLIKQIKTPPQVI